MKNSRRSHVDPFIVMDVMEQARRAEANGQRIIHMEVGQPGTAAPRGALEALAKAMKTQAMGYTVALGLPELRARISRLYQERYNVRVDAGRIVITPGSSGAFILAFTALFDRGDRVGLGDPGYPSYRQTLRALDLHPVGIPTKLENRLQPMPGELPDGLKGLIVASPSNPSGTMLSRGAIGDLIAACQRRGIAFISDEIYHGIEYEAKAVSALEISDDVYVINSFSKYYSMTGWRVGWMVVPPDHVRTIERLAQNLFICPPHVSQIAALAAMDCEADAQDFLQVYRDNRALMLDGLPTAGFTNIAPPDGAFYVYANVSDLTDDSRAFAAEVLAGAGVAVTPGLDFDPVRGHQTLRFSYARSTEDSKEGLQRLTDYMASRNRSS